MISRPSIVKHWLRIEFLHALTRAEARPSHRHCCELTASCPQVGFGAVRTNTRSGPCTRRSVGLALLREHVAVAEHPVAHGVEARALGRPRARVARQQGITS